MRMFLVALMTSAGCVSSPIHPLIPSPKPCGWEVLEKHEVERDDASVVGISAVEIQARFEGWRPELNPWVGTPLGALPGHVSLQPSLEGAVWYSRNAESHPGCAPGTFLMLPSTLHLSIAGTEFGRVEQSALGFVEYSGLDDESAWFNHIQTQYHDEMELPWSSLVGSAAEEMSGRPTRVDMGGFEAFGNKLGGSVDVNVWFADRLGLGSGVVWAADWGNSDVAP